MKNFFIVSALALSAFLVACGDDDSFSPRPRDISDEEELESSSSLISSSSVRSSSSISSSSARSSSSLSSSSSLRSSSSVSSSSSAASSSSVVSSSSQAKLTDESVYDSTANTLTDLRDNKVYRTTTIGDQVWMAENLNYVYLKPTASEDSSSFCYKDSVKYCDTYGRLYFWSAAVDSLGLFSEDCKDCGDGKECKPEEPIRGLCPKGWHLPSKAEFQTLLDEVGGKAIAGKKLKATSGWKDGANGDDEFGFSSLGGGKMYQDVFFNGFGTDDVFWGTTENSAVGVYGLFIDDDDSAMIGNVYKDGGSPIRCLKD